MKKILPILLALAAFLGCAPLPDSDTETTAEAAGAFTVYNDPSAFKAALVGGASPNYNAENECITVGGVDKYLVLDGTTWTLANSGLKVRAAVFDLVFVSEILTGTPDGEYDHVLHFLPDAYMPVRGFATENEGWRVLVPGEGSDDDHAVLVNP